MRAGDAAGGRRLLEDAALGGSLPAAVQLAIWELVGLGGPPDVVAAAARLRDVADRGHAHANALYAQLVIAGAAGLRRDSEQAKARLISAAELGDARAAMQLAALIPNLPAHSVVRTALMRTAASGGESIARMFLDRSPPAPPSPRIDWQDVRARVSMPHERPLPEAESYHERPRIACVRGLFTADECIYVALKGLPLLRPALIVSRDGSAVVDPMRSNEAAKFGLLEADVMVQSLDLRVAAALGHPAENGEGFALLRYQVGQQYLPHCDWIDPGREATRADLEQWGQRIATCVVYLNDSFAGGTTEFPQLGLEFRGGVGDAFIWDNVLPTGEIDPRTLHAGRPPTQGMKYLLSKWMRDKSQAGNDR
jgi:prolyl 4-hydroxylase